MKLYRVFTNIEKFNPAYVIAEEPTKAEQLVKDWLNERQYGFSEDRVVKTIEVVAENALYTSHNSVLISETITLTN